MNILVFPADFVGQYDIPSAIANGDIVQSYIDREEKKTIYRLLGKVLGDLLINYIALPKAPITSGLLVIGKTYQIGTFIAGDDFTNVGALSNATGVYFTATGTIPTTWTNLSSLIQGAVKKYDDLINEFYFSHPDPSFINDWFGDWNYYNINRNQFMQSHGLKDMLLCAVFCAYVSENQAQTSMSGIASGSIENGNVASYTNAVRFGENKWNNAGLDTWYAIQWFCKVYSPDIYPDYIGTRGVVRSSSIFG